MTTQAFSAQTLAGDLLRVRDIYSGFFSRLTPGDWRFPDGDSAGEWNLREVVAHLGALTTLGQESIEAALRGQSIAFPGLSSRFDFSRFNRAQIDERLPQTPERLAAGLLEALDRSIATARRLAPAEAGCTVSLPIYNRPVRVDELLGIQVMHPGLTHAAQVAEPAGVPPLWTQMGAPVRRRTIGRVMRALSLLYRQDLGGETEAVLAFTVGGEGGGQWHVILSPQQPGSAEGTGAKATLTLSFRDTSLFFEMFTGRLNLLKALLTRRLRPRGDLRLFLRFKSLFSVDAQG